MKLKKIKQIVPVLFLCVCMFLSGATFSQVNKLDDKNLEETMRNPWNPDQSQFLQDWLVLLPIPSVKGMEDLDTDFLTGLGGESGIRPTEGLTCNISGAELKWKPLKCKSTVDLASTVDAKQAEKVVAYAYTTVNREKAGKVNLLLGSDDGVKAWVNGKLVHRNAIYRGVTVDEDVVEVEMNAGENRLLLKILQGNGGWGFVARVSEGIGLSKSLTGTINFSLGNNDPKNKTLTFTSKGTLDQSLLRQTISVEACTSGGKTVARKTFDCNKPVTMNYNSWLDGVYEFRFAYKDIRDVPHFSYLTWYKGDILAAARELVNSAPGKDIRDPEASTHRMLADMVLCRLDNNLQNPDSSRLASLHPPLIEYAEMQANKQVRPGGFVRMAYIDDVDGTPQFCRCYLPLNYDPSKKWPMIVLLHGYNPDNPEYYNWWNADKRHDNRTDRYGVIFIEPHGRGNTWYTGIGDRDVLKCIEMAKQKFSVDDDRVYLTGESMGGFGVWNVATRHPELFAAISPIYGGSDFHAYFSKENLSKLTAWEEYNLDKTSSSSQMESLLTMPILVSHGDQDFNGVPVDYSRYLVRMLQRWDYNVRYIEVPGKGHEDLGLWDQYIPWLLQYKRDAFPRKVRVRAADLKTASAYWVKITQRNSPFEFMVADAEVLPNNLIRLDTKNVDEIALTPGESLIDFSKPVRIVWNGKLLEANNPAGKIVLKEEGYNPLSLKKTPQLSGPISDFNTTPFIVVIGTTSKDSMMVRAISQKAEMIVSNWKIAQKYEPRYKKDIDVTEDDIKKYSLFLLGGPDENKVSKQIFEKINFRITPDSIVLAGRPFKVKDAVLNAVYPNPYNNGRYVQIVAATSGAGFSFYKQVSVGQLFEYDYYISDGKIQNISAGAENEEILVASGSFDSNWKINDKFLNTGDENLRSKCAWTKVDNDFSTEIVSCAEPSHELMKLYCGTYDLHGIEININLADDGGLKIAVQPDNRFTARLSAVSENEFYSKEAVISIIFNKNETTPDYDMDIWENGYINTATKVH